MYFFPSLPAGPSKGMNSTELENWKQWVYGLFVVSVRAVVSKEPVCPFILGGIRCVACNDTHFPIKLSCKYVRNTVLLIANLSKFSTGHL